jgi:hypothetical protein
VDPASITRDRARFLAGAGFSRQAGLLFTDLHTFAAEGGMPTGRDRPGAQVEYGM